MPSYTGSSPYLLLTKYNNYADFGLDGINKIAILDPNATQIDPRTGTTVMKEVLTIAGPTPDPNFIAQHPNAVREWCINSAAVDPFTKSVLANSEDGKLYRWDLTTNTFTQVITLTPGIGEAYTPTIIGKDGTVYAINNATLFAIGLDKIGPQVTASTPSGSVSGSVDHVTLTFNEAILDGSFTLTDVDSFTGPNGAITPTAVNKINSTQYEVDFAAQSTAGDYTLIVGPHISDLAGNDMDQSQNGTNGEDPADRYTAAFTLTNVAEFHLDFGTSSSPLASGYTQVTEATKYSAALGYGWQSGTIGSRDRGTGTDLTRDLNYTPNGTFALDVPNGTYNVTVTTGDLVYARDQMGIFLEGVQMDTVTSAAGQIVVRTYTVTVTDGQLNLQMKDLGGSDPYTEIEGLDVVPTAPDTTGPRVTASTPSGTVSRNVDHVTLTFSEAILDGSFTLADVDSFTGPNGSITPTAVKKVSSTQYEVDFAAQTTLGDYSLTVGPHISDLAGNDMNQNQNGTNGEDPADRYTANFTLAAFSGAHFDFGMPSSPVASGYTQVTDNTVYSSASSYGWQSGTIGSRDRGTGTDLTRDLNYTPNGTFALDVPNGTYNVTVTTGDLVYARDQMGIFLEGVQVDTVTSAAGQIVVRTYTVTVTDGQLNLQMKDLGGSDPYTEIEGLDVVPTAPDTTGPRVTASTPSGTVSRNVDHVTLTFSEAILDGGFTLADVDSFTGPNGSITPTAVKKVSSTQYEVDFAAQTTLGDYSLTVGPHISDLAGNDMNQNQNGTNGEDPADRYTANFTLAAFSGAHFDFGMPSSPVASGYTQVTETTKYTAASSYGWQSGTIGSRDRGTGTDLTRDLNYTPNGTFALDVPNGTYNVTVTTGDLVYARDQMGIFLEGVQMDTVTSAAGQIVVRTYTVTVTDGQLNLQMKDLGGSDPYTEIEGLDVVPTAPDTTGPRVTASTPSGTVSRNVDHVTLTFSEAILDGSFTLADVDSFTGPNGSITPTAVKKVSSTQYEVDFAAQTTLGDYSLTVGPHISDLAGNDMNQNQNGTNGEDPADRYTANFTLAAFSGAHFDFGMPSSPLASGYTQVTDNTVYSSASGYGWQSGTIGSRDRGTGTDLTRDLNYTPNGTFALDVPNGTYNVTVTTGDLVYARDQMGIFLEGVQMDTVTSAAGQIVVRTYTVTVTDGQLNLQMKDLGGSDPYTEIEGLDVTPA